MRVNQFVFDEREESGHFERVPTKKQYAAIVSPYAETVRMDAVSRDAYPGPMDEEPDSER